MRDVASVGLRSWARTPRLKRTRNWGRGGGGAARGGGRLPRARARAPPRLFSPPLVLAHLGPPRRRVPPRRPLQPVSDRLGRLGGDLGQRLGAQPAHRGRARRRAQREGPRRARHRRRVRARADRFGRRGGAADGVRHGGALALKRAVGRDDVGRARHRPPGRRLGLGKADRDQVHHPKGGRGGREGGALVSGADTRRRKKTAREQHRSTPLPLPHVSYQSDTAPSRIRSYSYPSASQNHASVRSGRPQ